MDDELKLTHITWVDACHIPGWYNSDEISRMQGPPATVSVGYIVKETDEAVWLAQSVNNKRAGDVLCIPQGMIRDRFGMANPNEDE